MAGSAFPSQNSKKNTIIGALLEAEMIKKRTPTQREGDRERVRERERDSEPQPFFDPSDHQWVRSTMYHKNLASPIVSYL